MQLVSELYEFNKNGQLNIYINYYYEIIYNKRK